MCESLLNAGARSLNFLNLSRASQMTALRTKRPSCSKHYGHGLAPIFRHVRSGTMLLFLPALGRKDFNVGWQFGFKESNMRSPCVHVLHVSQLAQAIVMCVTKCDHV